MLQNKDNELASCPKCSRIITKFDVDLGRCVVCDLDISAIGKELSMIQEETLLETFADEIKKGTKKIDYYNTAINILKAYLVNVVCVRKKLRTSFHYIDDSEIRCFLFRLVNVRSIIFMEFDYSPKYVHVNGYTKSQIKSKKLGAIKSYARLTNFEHMMDLAMAVYHSKKSRTESYKKDFVPSVNLYRYR